MWYNHIFNRIRSKTRWSLVENQTVISLYVYNRSVANAIGAPVAQWAKCWPTVLAILSSSPARGEMFSTINGVPLHTAFHYNPPTVPIWLIYCWKGRKIASHPSSIYHCEHHFGSLVKLCKIISFSFYDQLIPCDPHRKKYQVSLTNI